MTADKNKVSYHGRILNGDFSPELKEKIKRIIPVYHAFDQSGSPAIPYISAWQETDKNIWYEFVSRKFLTLLDCGPTNIADIFRSVIVDRRIYKSEFVDPADAKEVTSRDELDETRESIREESQKRGLIEAVYKLELSQNQTLWLKDQAEIVAFPDDDTSLSLGCLTIVTTEMEVEEERQRLTVEKNRLEHELQKTHHLEAIGNLAEGIAHDLNHKILGVEKNIALTLESLGHDYHGDTSAFQDYQNLKTAEQQIKEIKQIANRLLTFAGRGVYNYFETDLDDMITYTLQELKIMMPDVVVKTDLREGLWKINADRAMIGRALLNIYQHASRLDSGIHNFELSTHNQSLPEEFVEPYGREPGNYVRLRIAIATAVMHEQEVDRALEPFHTADKGLRMATVFGIVKNHNGIMTVASDVQRGTVFDIYLPAI